MLASAHSPLQAPHLRSALRASRAQLQRSARLGQALELAVWTNAHDEVHYSHQCHHTLSVYLAGGQGSQLQGEQQARGGAGRFCVFPAEHESRWLVREPVQFLHLYISDIAWADRVVRLLDAEPRSHTLRPQIYAQDKCYQQWAQALAGLDWCDAEQAWRADWLSQRVLDRLVVQSATPRLRAALARPVGGLPSAARRRVLDYVDSHLADYKALTLSELAQVAGLSEFHFARMFARSMGCTVHGWVMQRRLARVHGLLQLGQALRKPPTLDELAAQAGFSSASHVLRSFRAHYGVTPAQYGRWQPIQDGPVEGLKA